MNTRTPNRTARHSRASTSAVCDIVYDARGASQRFYGPFFRAPVTVKTGERPAEAGRSRSLGKTSEDRASRFASRSIAPPEGIEPSLPGLRYLEPASTGGGHRRSRGTPDARCEKHTRGAHSVSCQCLKPHISGTRRLTTGATQAFTKLHTTNHTTTKESK